MSIALVVIPVTEMVVLLILFVFEEEEVTVLDIVCGFTVFTSVFDEDAADSCGVVSLLILLLLLLLYAFAIVIMGGRNGAEIEVELVDELPDEV